MIYITQTTEKTKICESAPCIYAFFTEPATPLLERMGTFVFLLVTGILVFYLYQKKFELNFDNLILLALVFSLFTPFFMTHMHERYFYLADVFAFIYVFMRKKGLFICLLINFASIICCFWNVLRGYGEPNMVIPFEHFRVGAILNLVAVVLLIIELIKIKGNVEQTKINDGTSLKLEDNKEMENQEK